MDKLTVARDLNQVIKLGYIGEFVDSGSGYNILQVYQDKNPYPYSFVYKHRTKEIVGTFNAKL